MKKLFFIPLLMTAAILQAAEDRILADFEGKDFGNWTVEGEAFGTGPVTGNLPQQGRVQGFLGQHFANSYHGTDKSTGSLTTPSFVIDRDYLSFFIGGGAHEGTALQLLIDGKVVASQSGLNIENLEQQALDLQPFKGKTAQIRLMDQVTGGWGHVNVDQIVLTNEKPDVLDLKQLSREVVAQNKYLLVPVSKRDGQDGQMKKSVLQVLADGVPVRNYDVGLATNEEDVSWTAFFTLEDFEGQQLTISADRVTEEGFALIRQSDSIPGENDFYNERWRPQFHFTQKVGWINDPNGMVYHNGTWHLFFQHNPVSLKWGNMTWGHATSKDLLHWEQQPNALFPRTMAKGDAFSGGATVDKLNTAGWGKDTLVAFFTDTRRGECIAYSTDNGETFTYYEGNPVVKHKGRDPKVIWYAYDDTDTPLNAQAKELGGHWVMVVYNEAEERGRNAAFYTSTNMKNWTEQSHLPNYFECMELFELPVDGNPDNTRWVVFAADAKYAMGQFDGKTFTPEHEGKHQVHYGPYYASQIFDNAPDGRKIQMGWLKINAPGAPYNQHFSFPHFLTLKTTEDGIRMHVNPIKEIENLRVASVTRQADLQAGVPLEIPVKTDLLDIRATVEIGTAKKILFQVPGQTVVYDVENQLLHPRGAPLKPIDGKITVQILCDRSLIEIAGNEGRVFISSGKKYDQRPDFISVVAERGDAKLLNFEVHELKSIWRTK